LKVADVRGGASAKPILDLEAKEESTRSAAAVVIWLLLLPLPRIASAPPADSWKGKYSTFRYNFLYGKDTKAENVVSRNTELWRTDYELYQNDAGVARQELTHMNWKRSIEAPMDVRLLDYGHGYGRVWDRGGTQLIEGPLGPLATGKSLGTRQILGFTCEGKEYEWTTFQHAKVQLQSWSAQNSTFRVPLLRVEYFTDDTDSLLGLTVEVVTAVEPANDLPSSLFEVPLGLHVSRVLSID